MPESVSRLATDLGGDLLRASLLGAAPPELDGRYRIEKVLGRGASGVVVQARDERLARVVAIKVAPATAASQRMLDEARALARLKRPRFVVQVWETASGRLQGSVFHGLVNYIVMELVTGVTLREWRSATSPNMAEVLTVYADVAVGLETVHTAGMAHGDIKPDNVILDLDGVPTLVDFGFAALLHGQGAGVQRAEVMGTVPYMAPEIRQGDVRLASDVHAYAVSLWEALTDQLPFEEEYAAAGVFGLASLPREALVPLRLRRVLKSAMRHDPAARPSIHAVRAAVQGAAASQRRARTWSPIASRVVLLGSLVAGVAVVGTSLPEWLEAPSTSSHDAGAQAEAAFQQLQQVWSTGTEAEYLDGYEEPVACFYDRPNAPRNSVRLRARREHFAKSVRPPPARRFIRRQVVSPTQVVLHEERVRADGTRTEGFRTVEMHYAEGRWRVRQEVSSSKHGCWSDPVSE